MNEQSNSFHPMNQPYINYGHKNVRKHYHTIAGGYDIMPSYESESVLKNSRLSSQGNFMRDVYSQSSTNINMQPYDVNAEQGKTMSKQQKNHQNSLQYSISQNGESPRSHHNQPSISQNNQLSNRRSIPSLTNESHSINHNHSRFSNRSQPLQQQQQSSTQLLHEKIFYLQKQLQQLTTLLQQESRHTFQGHEYEQIAIENAQLTIRVQELQQQIAKISTQKQRTQQQLLQLGQQYQRSHTINNQLRERILQLQQKITSLQKNSLSTISQQESISNNTNNNNESKEKTNQYTKNLQQENARLTEEIENLLSKLHNFNVEYNQEQQKKDQLMQKMNQQLEEIEKLRKQVNDYDVQKLQLQEMNQYLKQEIAQVNTISANKLKQLQQKYIKQDMQRQLTQQELENFNFHLQQKVQQLQGEVKRLNTQLLSLNNNGGSDSPTTTQKSYIHTPQKSQPFKDLFDNQDKLLKDQISLLNQELIEEKQRHVLIKNQYTEMLHNQQTQINQLENQNRKVSMQNRTFKVQLEDKNKQIEQIQKEYQQVIANFNQIKLTKNMEINQYFENQRLRYEENIKSINEQQKRLLQEKEQQFRDYQTNIRGVESQLENTKYEMQRLIRTLENKQQEIRQKDYLAQELFELQKSHQQLIQEVKLVQKSKIILQQQIQQKEETFKRNEQGESLKFKMLIDEKDSQINRLELTVKNQDTAINQINQQNNNLKQQLQALQMQKKNLENNINIQKQKPIQYSPASCPLCPEVLKQFSIYKQLMELKFETMNEMLDEMKISFIRAQIELKNEINRDKSKYEHWIQKYDTHDKEYRVLMERLWEWEKINAKNEMLREDIDLRKGRPGSSYASEINDQSGNVNRKQSTQYGRERQPSAHLSELQYDLYLIKLQNSTLRSQITGLEKQLSQKGKSPATQRQIEQLKRYSDNLLSQNEELKNRLTQIVNQRKMTSSKDISYQNQQGRKQSIFERYSSQNITKEMIEKSRSEEKALASAELLINKLKKQNDNLIEAKRILQQQLDQQNLRNRSLQKEFQLERQKNRRENEIRVQNVQKTQILDRYNLPIEYIRYHPEHKKLQSEYVSLKRSFLEMELQYKKSKETLQQDLQKLKIENEFHQERINELEKNQKSTSYFSLNRKSLESNKIEQESYEKQINFAESKAKTLQERCQSLEKKLQIKEKQLESYKKKHQALMRQMELNQGTPRNINQSIDRIDKIVSNLEVSPIQSPQWDQTSAQQNSDRFLSIGQIGFDEKYVQKLKTCMDKKMIELEITPRQTSNLISKATWFIERLARDIKELRNNIEILKGQRKAIMKERNDLKEKLQNIDQVSVSDGSKPFAKIKSINTESNQVLEESISKGLNKMKIIKGYQSVPKLNFDSKSQTPMESNAKGDQNFFNDVVKQTLELKNQRRNGLKKFQEQVQNLSYN